MLFGYRQFQKLCYLDTDSFIVYIKTDNTYKDIAEHVETITKRKNEIGSTKGELGRKIMTKSVRLRAKTYSYLINDRSEDKKVQGTKKYVIKRKLKLKNYSNCLEKTQFEKLTRLL